ncbi:hypothetical protein [Nocardia sp. IFM 10818]
MTDTPDLDTTDPDAEISDFRPAALERADALRERALIPAYSGGSDEDWDLYRLAPDAPLPPYLLTALADAEFTGPEGPWPQFARTRAPLDWPSLIENHPGDLVADQTMLAANQGATWASIIEAYRVLQHRGGAPRLEVCLAVEPDGRIAVEPIALEAENEVEAAVIAAVDEVLVAGGRPPEALHDDDVLLWLLDA